MKKKIYQVHAFNDNLFSGNAAAVCPLNEWLTEELLQKITMENNLAKTGFYVKEDNQFNIRCLTPTVEVDLCGHASLAAAFIIFNVEKFSDTVVSFYSGEIGFLRVTREDEFIALNFPTDIFVHVELSQVLLDGFDVLPIEALKGKTDYVLVFENGSQIKSIVPNFPKVALVDGRSAIVTAIGDKFDFVSRFFSPQSGIDEGPVTGSAHTALIPYWAEKLNKVELTAVQLSARKGCLKFKYQGSRVEISGKARLYLTGEIQSD